METVQLPTVTCPFCDYTWVPRIPMPTRCPGCAKTLTTKGNKSTPKAA